MALAQRTLMEHDWLNGPDDGRPTAFCVGDLFSLSASSGSDDHSGTAETSHVRIAVRR